MKRPAQVDLAPPPPAKPPRQIESLPGAPDRVCANCEHFALGRSEARAGICHNGISGKYRTRTIDGCGHGFWPAVDRFPLQAGPGGVW